MRNGKKSYASDSKKQKAVPMMVRLKKAKKHGEINKKQNYKSNKKLINVNLRDWIPKVGSK